MDQIPGVNHGIPMETFPAMIVALRSGAIDGYIAERPGAEADTMANPELTYVQFDEGKGFEASEDDTAIAVGLVYGIILPRRRCPGIYYLHYPHFQKY